MSFEPIAIVGRGCALPGALTPEALWENCVAGVDLLGPGVPGRWRLSPQHAIGEGPDRAATDVAGIVHGFDAAFSALRATKPFGVPDETLDGLDPLFHLLLYAAHQALTDAGTRAAPERTAAIIGNLGYPTDRHSAYVEHIWSARNGVSLPHIDPRNRFQSGFPVHLLGAALGVLGTRFAIDAACASGLTSLSLAADLLHDRKADLVLAGGVNRADDLFLHVGFQALSALSPTGRSRPFHRQADGLVPAEGAAVVALMRLADARERGLTIHGVLRGAGLANDGRGKGLLVPMSEGQVRAMRIAWSRSGLDPRDVGLVECHATGTSIGDGVEAASLAAVFGQAKDVPIGSLKGNLGHLITAAGSAGLLKVLGALRHKTRPPTLHVDDPHPALAGGPLRLIRAAEPWPSEGPRIAALDAFGFGGNNAHLIVSEDDASIPLDAAPTARVSVAVTGLGAAVGDGHGVADFAAVLRGDRPVGRADVARLPLSRLRFPPRDLQRALGQQTRLLEAAFEAIGDANLPRERTGVWIGMGTDSEIARYGLRWRLAENTEANGLTAARDAAMQPLDSAGVVGHMPNIPANRISSQFDAAGPGFTVSSEERSGLVALELARRALANGEVDVALVGAADLCDEVGHAVAASALLPADRHRPGDAAVLLVLQRADDAIKAGTPILATLADAPGAHQRTVGDALTASLGHSHAASGLVYVAAAIVADPVNTSTTVHVAAYGDIADAVTVRVGPARPIERPAPTDPVDVVAHRSEVVFAPPGADPLPLAPALQSSDAQGTAGFTDTADDPTWWQAEVAPSAQLAPTPPAPRSLPAVATQHASGTAAAVAAAVRQMSAAHQAFLASQAVAHEGFMRLRAAQVQVLLRGVPGQAAAFTTAAPPTPSRLPPAAPLPLKPLPPPPSAPISGLPGPKYTRGDLEILASDKISRVFGTLFERQDGFPRQVRMPEPPLLLADRVTGIDAKPGSMGLGRIFTETDVLPDSWYLHDGAMPAGILIESGQADLLLISWLGVDFHNRGERVYRLLGCELTYRTGLPTPGTTLKYEIHVDGHANHGAVRLFFFHYDCKDQHGNLRLQVRQGQAGFFTDAELDDSKGILWTPEEGEHTPAARVDPPRISCTRQAFDRAAIEAFARGDAFTTFGPGYERLATHVRTPRISGPPMLFLHNIDVLDPTGGPWGRGYLRATQDFSPDDWFFPGHFKGDPCMPGTLMFEGCLQALAFYMTSLGVTPLRDGYRFEIVPDVAYPLRCRGQATPTSRQLVYEVFIDGFEDGDNPVLWADFLCTVDGRKAFHARRVGLRLVCDFPISSRPELLASYVEPKPVAVVDGFPFDYASLIACAWGKPSAAFGPQFGKYDQGRHCARLPGPPYHFMSRVLRIEGRMGDVKPGALVELEYDIPSSEWYFDENGNRTMPFAVLLEAALQPCGWLAVYVGSALDVEHDLFFRNLDGDGVLHTELFPTTGTLRTVAKLTAVSKAGGMIVEGFDVRCFVGDVEVYTLKTVFGFFSRESLANQVGMPPSDAERAELAEPGDLLALKPLPHRPGAPALAKPMLLMIDRVTGLWPTGGKKGLGRIRCTKDVDPTEWFFKAHFFSDPVQPGSLGLEAMLQALQVYMIETGLWQGIAHPRFEPVGIETRLKWKYRGQVVPRNKTVTVDLHIVEVRHDESGITAVADGYLWVDGLRIYSAEGMAMRVVAGAPPPDETLDPATSPWLGDHRPTWTVAALPAMDMADRLISAGGPGVSGLTDVRVNRWLTLPARVRTHVDGAAATLSAWREAPDPTLSRWEPIASGTLVREPALTPAPWPLPDAAPVPDPYAEGRLFHGPALQFGVAFRLGSAGGVAILDPERGSWPAGAWGAGLLDALTHVVPHDAFHRWFPDVGADLAGYPLHIISLRRFEPFPASGRIEVVAIPRPRPDARTVAVGIQARADGRVLLELELIEVLVPKGSIGSAPPKDRAAFLRDATFVPGMALSTPDGPSTHLTPHTLRGVDWLPGTVAAAWRVTADPLVEVAAKDHLAARLSVHPSTIDVIDGVARSPQFPLNPCVLHIERGDGVTVMGEPSLDLTTVRAFWDRWFGIGPWPVEDLYYGLIQRFVRRVVVTDPAGLAAVKGRSLLFLANHQVGVESLLFSIVASGLADAPTVTVAKAEHRTSWLGTLIRDCFSYPGVTDPEVITFFDRDDRESLPVLVQRLATEMVARRPRNVMVHVEGTRSLSCRTPVQKLSGAFIDMALEVGAPIVPVRFAGALPIEPLNTRIEFPLGMGQQDIFIGAPLEPKFLAALPYKQRKDAVINGINGLGPSAQEEAPHAPDPNFAERVKRHAKRTGVSEEDAVLYCILAELSSPSEGTRTLLGHEGSEWYTHLRARIGRTE